MLVLLTLSTDFLKDWIFKILLLVLLITLIIIISTSIITTSVLMAFEKCIFPQISSKQKNQLMTHMSIIIIKGKSEEVTKAY